VQVQVTAMGFPSLDTAADDYAYVTARSISGKVTDAATGLPIADLSVQVYDTAGIFLEGLEAQTDDQGQYSFAGLTPGHYKLGTAHEPGYIGQWYQGVNRQGNPWGAGATEVDVSTADATDIDFALTMGRSISGTITDAVTGLPLPDVNVQVWEVGGWWLRGLVIQTDAQGQYSTAGPGLIPGLYRVRTANDHYVNEWFDNVICQTHPEGTGATVVDISTADATHVDFALGRGYKISGTITDAATGLPLPNVNVQVADTSGNWLGGGGTQTDGQGQYSFGGMIPGLYKLQAAWTDQSYILEWYDNVICQTDPEGTGAAEVDVRAADATDIDFALARGRSISGTITDALTGLPIPNLGLLIN
jgi:protocatechuate 3,4-dioxygenase beta subunit